MQDFLCTEHWAGADYVDHAAWVTSDFFHQKREVLNLGLEVIDQRALDVQQGRGLCVMILQLMQALLNRWIITVLLFTLWKAKQTKITTPNQKSDVKNNSC